MEIDKDTLFPYLLYDSPIHYTDNIVLYPVKMKDILTLQELQACLMLRKDATFRSKQIIRMRYLEFIKYACRNQKLAQEYDMPLLPYYYDLVLRLLTLVCSDAEIKYNNMTLDILINGEQVTDEKFDDLRRIIFIQNDIDFDIDEFMNIDTVNALEKARKFEEEKSKDDADIEDYIDAVAIALGVTGEYISNLTIRKFWRYVKRINKHEQYQAFQNASLTGFVTFKEPMPHWMTTLDTDDKYKDLKTDEDELREKIG